MEVEPEELEDMLDGAMVDSFLGSLGPQHSLLAYEPPFADVD